MVRTSQGKTVKKTPAKGKAPAEAKTKTKISKSKRTGSFETYAYKVLKQVHPDTGIKSGAMGEVNAICMNLFHNIANRAKSIMAVGGKNTTLSSRLVQSATRSVLPGELAKHAVSEGTKAVTKFADKKKSAKPISRSSHAGLQFPVGRIDTMLRKYGFSRVSGTAPVYLAAVIEYFCAEILELAGNAARDFKRVRISTRHIVLAMRNDSELDLYARKNCLILPGGYMPHINKFYVENVKEQAKKRKNAKAKAKRASGGKAKAPVKRVSGGKRKSQ